MIRLSREQAAGLADWFQPEQPGPPVGALISGHLLLTGHGQAWADRWPAPRALLVEVAGNYALAGDPGALRPADLPPLAGFIAAPQPFLPLLRQALSDIVAWERVVYTLPGDAAAVPAVQAVVRPLAPADAAALAGLSPETDWIAQTWGGPAGLAGSGHAWGAFVDGRLASVAATFFLGARLEDVGVVTELGFRGRGLSSACAAALCPDIRARGRAPHWGTSADNLASRRVAEKLGFVLQRREWLYGTGTKEP